jgi:hypothetical protein
MTPRVLAALFLLARAASSCGPRSSTVVSRDLGDAGDSGALGAEGCGPERSAAATPASMPALSSAGEAPYPCFSLTGVGTSESSIGIARDGTVYVAPAYTNAGQS